MHNASFRHDAEALAQTELRDQAGSGGPRACGWIGASRALTATAWAMRSERASKTAKTASGGAGNAAAPEPPTQNAQCDAPWRSTGAPAGPAGGARLTGFATEQKSSSTGPGAATA